MSDRTDFIDSLACDLKLHLGAARHKASLNFLMLNLAQLLGNFFWRKRVEEFFEVRITINLLKSE